MPGLVQSVFRTAIIFSLSALFVGCTPLKGSDNTSAANAPSADVKEQEANQAPPTDQVVETPKVEAPVLPVCPEPQVITKPAACPKVEKCPRIVQTNDPALGGLRVVGQVEYVDVMSIGMRKKARIDSGAETTSIDATDIVEFERDGDKWVRFHVEDRTTGETAEVKAPVARTVRIKQHGVENVRRYVVYLELRMGHLKDKVEVTLADRDRFEFPILIGRNFLHGRAVVDVSRKYLTLE